MSNAKKDFIYKNATALQQRAEKMFNKPKYSDTLFLVNSVKFHASSHLVSAASDALDLLLSTHFENCSDKEIKIFKVKYEDSFSVILKYIYGMDINFTKMRIAVMCEVISLCDTYELSEFSKDLKTYLSTLVCFNIDSAVVLLNTAKKTNLTELYQKLSVFAYENAEKLLEHNSFVDLQHDVLVDLLKSDWFFALEINILKGSLMWHSDMYKDPKGTDAQFMNDSEKRLFADVKGVGIDNISDSCSEVDQAPDTNLEDDEEIQELANQDINKPKIKHHDEVVKDFTENILKSLLSHIRLPRISAFELVKASKTELFSKYIEYLGEEEFFSKSLEPRKKFVLQTEASVDSGTVPDGRKRGIDLTNAPSTSLNQTSGTVVQNGSDPNLQLSKSKNFLPKLKKSPKETKQKSFLPFVKPIFTVKFPAYNNMSTWNLHNSDEVCQTGPFSWVLYVKSKNQNNGYVVLEVILDCTSSMERDWECNFTCDVSIKQNSKLVLQIPSKHYLMRFNSSKIRIYYSPFDETLSILPGCELKIDVDFGLIKYRSL